MPEGQAPWRSLPTPALTWSSITQLSRQCKALEDGSSPLRGYPRYTWSFQVLSSVSVCFKAQFPGFVQPFTLGGWFLDSDLVPFQIAPFGPHLYSHAVVRQNTSQHWGLIRTEHNRKTIFPILKGTLRFTHCRVTAFHWAALPARSAACAVPQPLIVQLIISTQA